MFGNNIRAIVPQLAMSGGTMICCACDSILMGKHSNLGPIDPQFFTQFGPLAAHGVIEEFQRAYDEIRKDQMKIALWQPIIAKYSPTFIGECEKSIAWSKEIVKQSLVEGMFRNRDDKELLAEGVASELSDHIITKSHSRHITLEKARSIGLVIEELEEDQKLQEAVLSVHHSSILTLSSTGAYKIIENQNGIAYIKAVQSIMLQQKA
jgi:ClpP class serine protease